MGGREVTAASSPPSPQPAPRSGSCGSARSPQGVILTLAWGGRCGGSGSTGPLRRGWGLAHDQEGEDLTLGMKIRASVVVTVPWVWKKKKSRVQSGCMEGASANLRAGGRGTLAVGGSGPSPLTCLTGSPPSPSPSPDLCGGSGWVEKGTFPSSCPMEDVGPTSRLPLTPTSEKQS